MVAFCSQQDAGDEINKPAGSKLHFKKVNLMLSFSFRFPLCANLAACRRVDESCSSTGCHKPLCCRLGLVCYFPYGPMWSEAHGAQHSALLCSRMFATRRKSHLQFYANADGGSQQTQRAAPTVLSKKQTACGFAASFQTFLFQEVAWKHELNPFFQHRDGNYPGGFKLQSIFTLESDN